jgi:hypothetical protein
MFSVFAFDTKTCRRRDLVRPSDCFASILDLEQLCVVFPAVDRNDIDGATARFDGLFAEREGALADGTGVEKEPEAGEQLTALRR